MICKALLVELLSLVSTFRAVGGSFTVTTNRSFLAVTVFAGALLETGGAFYTLMQSVDLEDGKDNPNTSYLTKLVDAGGRNAKLCSWLKTRPL